MILFKTFRKDYSIRKLYVNYKSESYVTSTKFEKLIQCYSLRCYVSAIIEHLFVLECLLCLKKVRFFHPRYTTGQKILLKSQILRTWDPLCTESYLVHWIHQAS